MVQHLTFIVQGQVQGVGFRHYTMLTAQRLGLKGYVQNLPDGSVKIEAEGDQASLDALVAAWHSPELVSSEVLDIRASAEPLQNYSDFVIKKA